MTKPENRIGIAKYLRNAKELSKEGFTEDRLAFEWNDRLWPITDNFPHWTASKIVDFAKSQNLPIRRVKVRVSLEEEDK